MSAIWLNAVVAVLLAVTLVYCVQLNRRLSKLRNAHDQLRDLLDGFAKTTEKAEASIAELKRASTELGAELQTKTEAARRLTDELSVMTQSGNDLADRLEQSLLNRRENTPRFTAVGDEDEIAPAPASGRSESERELLEALRRAR